ncbi:MAG: hypothetical protein KBT87_07995 [Gammaproteobacteria bacterium]|nr:hypothetical protein [Gammaproteobacteria bacterium]MBQ0774595.1 hypothetical protein [Gammaproteobacteria bacterium]
MGHVDGEKMTANLGRRQARVVALLICHREIRALSSFCRSAAIALSLNGHYIVIAPSSRRLILASTGVEQK